MSQFSDLLRCGLQQADETEVFTQQSVDKLIEGSDVPQLIEDLAGIYTSHVEAYFSSKEKNLKAPTKGKK